MCLQTIGSPREIKNFVLELLKYHGKFELYKQLKDWDIPKFPVDGASLKDRGCPTGKLMGSVINRLKVIWVKNEFKSSKEELLEQLPAVLLELNIVDGKQIKKPKIN